MEVAVTVDGITLSQIHPVLDNNNKPIQKPNAFQINTSLQRCLVKAIALHGLGLYIYQGEDLPTGTEEQEKESKAEYNAEQLEQRRQFFLKKIEELVWQLGSKGNDLIVEFEEKAKCKLTDMNEKVLKRVVALLTLEKQKKSLM